MYLAANLNNVSATEAQRNLWVDLFSLSERSQDKEYFKKIWKILIDGHKGQSLYWSSYNHQQYKFACPTLPFASSIPHWY